jgi:ferredoxin-NADP reductase
VWCYPHACHIVSLVAAVCHAGSTVLVSAPMGKGFPVDQIPPDQFPTVLIFATGSGAHRLLGPWLRLLA